MEFDGRSVRNSLKISPITRRLLNKLFHEPHRDDAGVRDRALLVLGFGLARRWSELAALTLSDVHIGKFVTTAAELGLPECQIQEVTLRKSPATLTRYIRTHGQSQTQATDAVLGR